MHHRFEIKQLSLITCHPLLNRQHRQFNQPLHIEMDRHGTQEFHFRSHLTLIPGASGIEQLWISLVDSESNASSKSPEIYLWTELFPRTKNLFCTLQLWEQISSGVGTDVM